METKRLFLAASIVTLWAFTGCSVKEEIAQPSEFNPGSIMPSVLIIDPGNEETKADYSIVGNRLRVKWEDGDAVQYSPNGCRDYGFIYRVPSGGAASNTFVAEGSAKYVVKHHLFYFPGEKVYNDPSFLNFSYAGQVQKKSDPLGHIKDYHTMRQKFETTDYTLYKMSSVTFAGCQQSGCIRFVLRGMTFQNPTKLTLQVIKSGAPAMDLYETNSMDTAFSDSSTGEPVVWPSNCSDLSIGLEGYGTESELVVYMMHTCSDIPLEAGCSLRVTVQGSNSCYADTYISSATAIKGGYYSTLVVDSGWKELKGDYTEYPWDGDVVTLQNPDRGLDLVLMGDGFIKADFDDGTYDRAMRDAADAFFGIEPYASIRKDFNIYYVKTPSPQRLEATPTGLNGAENSGNNTKFNVLFTPNSTTITGDNALARTYAKNAFSHDANERIKEAMIIVIANQHCHAGTCSMSMSTGADYGSGVSVAYCSLGLDEEQRVIVVQHEAGGHGFGKLADEYFDSTAGSFNPSRWSNLETNHKYGFFRNVDKYVTSTFNSTYGTSYALTSDSEVLWYDLMNTSNHYESSSVESLGFYEGAYTHLLGFCRPTYASINSMMFYKGNFNAIGRRQILYRYRRLKGELTSDCFGTSSELNYFLDWDRTHFLSSTRSSLPALTKGNCVEQVSLPYPPPVLEYGEWIDGEFHKTR